MNDWKFEELFIGQKETFSVEVTREMEDNFRAISGDCNPLHRDDAFAMEIGDGKFSRHVCFGMLTASFYSTLAGVYLPGKYSLLHSLNIKFQKPVYAGEVLTVSGEIVKKQDDLKLILVKAVIKNADSQTVSKADMKVLVLR